MAKFGFKHRNQNNLKVWYLKSFHPQIETIQKFLHFKNNHVLFFI